MKQSLIIFLSLIIIPAFAVEKDGLGETVPSTYKITKTEAYKSDQSSLKITFECPGDKCSKHGISMIMNKKDTIKVKLDSKNNFEIKTRPGKYRIFFTSAGYNHLLTDSIELRAASRTYMTVVFSARKMHTRKPVIYLYPQTITNVSIQLDYKGKLEFTYPEYHDGWSVTAHPDGTIESMGKKYNYIFWDGEMDPSQLKIDYTKGQVVNKQALVTYLENTLASIGLNSKEIQDFITYWVPVMNKNEANFIHFYVNEKYNEIASINVSPKPASQLRVFMLWQNANIPGPDLVTPQQFPHFKREGFTLIEWGGSEINPSFE